MSPIFFRTEDCNLIKLCHLVIYDLQNLRKYTIYDGLALYATTGITASEALNLINGYEVKVTIDGVLQGRCSDGKLEGLALRLLRQTRSMIGLIS